MVVVYPSTQEAEVDGSLNLRPAMSTERVQGQRELHRKTILKTKKESSEFKKSQINHQVQKTAHTFQLVVE